LNKIAENWDLFEHKTKIRTYLTKLDANWDQKGILRWNHSSNTWKMAQFQEKEEKGWTRRVAYYTLIEGELFRRRFSRPLLKCITKEKVSYIMQEIHEDMCGYHPGPKMMAARILRASYFCPTMEDNCSNYARKCVLCQ